MTSPYSQLTPDQLRSAIVQRDEQLRAEIALCKELEGDIERLKEQLMVALGESAKVNGFRDDLQRKYQTLRDKYSEACSHLESSQERCKVCEGLLVDERNNTKSLLTTYKTALKELSDSIDNFMAAKVDVAFDTRLNDARVATHALLEGSKGEV